VSSGACCTCTGAARRQAEPDEGEHTFLEREIVVVPACGRDRERDGEHGESGADAGRNRTRAAAGDAEPHLRALPVPAELAYLLHRRPRLRPHPPTGLPQLRRRMVRA
jgi:hypothetical protein